MLPRLAANQAAASSTELELHDYELQLSMFFADPDNNIVEITTWVDKEEKRRL